MPIDPEERFWSKVDKHSGLFYKRTQCWVWKAGVDRCGYGQFHSNRNWKSHIWAWVKENGPVPEGLQLDHLCRVRPCVRPYHLEPVTCQVNLSRGENHNRNKTHCKQGHPYTIFRANRRGCRPCHSEEEKKRKRKINAELERRS